MKRLSFAAALAALALTAPACNGTPQVIQVPAAAAPSAEKPVPQFTVSGLATLDVVPNCADLTLEVSASAGKSATAAAQAQAKQADLVARLEAAGVTRADIKLSSVQIAPAFEYSASGAITSRKFGASIRVLVTTKDFTKISDLMDAGAAAGVTSMHSSFRHDGIDQLKKQVRDLALKAAKEKAAQTAAALGFKVGQVANVTENPNGQLWRNAYFANERAPQVAATMDASGLTGLGVETQELSVEVSVAFEIDRS